MFRAQVRSGLGRSELHARQEEDVLEGGEADPPRRDRGGRRRSPRCPSASRARRHLGRGEARHGGHAPRSARRRRVARRARRPGTGPSCPPAPSTTTSPREARHERHVGGARPREQLLELRFALDRGGKVGEGPWLAGIDAVSLMAEGRKRSRGRRQRVATRGEARGPRAASSTLECRSKPIRKTLPGAKPSWFAMASAPRIAVVPLFGSSLNRKSSSCENPSP